MRKRTVDKTPKLYGSTELTITNKMMFGVTCHIGRQGPMCFKQAQSALRILQLRSLSPKFKLYYIGSTQIG